MVAENYHPQAEEQFLAWLHAVEQVSEEKRWGLSKGVEGRQRLSCGQL